LHGLLLWLPEIHLPLHEKELPPLLAKLEPLPKASAKLARKTKPRPKPRPVVPPTPVLAASAVIPASAQAAAEDLAASAVSAASAVVAAEPPVAASAPLPASAPAVAATEAAAPEPQHPPLPKHARLRFNVYQGEQNFKVGESLHELEIDDGRYTLKASVQTTGLASLLKSYRMVQTSTGTASAQTLRPEVFSEEVTDSSGKQTSQADFDWTGHTIHFSKGGSAVLPPQAQDILSILYQFPPMREQEESITINIGTGKKFEKYQFEIVFEEQLKTPMGTLQTVHFRKQHAAHEEGLEIWFAQEYRLLPVKMRYLDRDGKIAAEAIITDIRVSDE
jgi:hypothetical protein